MTAAIDTIGPFAGPGGWSVAAAALGLREVGIELDPHACATRAAAGHLTIRADVAAMPTHRMAGKIRGLIASPPCGTFSAAGKGEGIGDMPRIHRCLDDLAAGRDTRAQLAAACSDPRTPLVVEPLRYALDLRPEWVALEQVPAVLPLWEHIARILRGRGYSTWAGILNAADFGLGQVRRRAILIASQAKDAAPPAPTHSEHGGHDLFDGCTPRWQSMAEALGWNRVQVLAGTKERLDNVTQRAIRAAMDNPRHWAWTRPAPTLSGTVGHVGGKHVLGHLNLEPAQAAQLQGFPDNYPFCGNKGQVALQIGNAMPVPLALHVLSAATGIAITEHAEGVAA